MHLGGCHSELLARSTASVDHMIPKSFIGFMPSAAREDFYADWNTQPMCRVCNESRGGQLNGWPVFGCLCHYPQIDQSGGIYVCERTIPKERRHLLNRNAVSSDGSVALFFSARLPGNGNSVGYSKNQKNPGGHLISTVPENLVKAFNWFELARIGEAKGNIVCEKDTGERCIFDASGEVFPDSEHWCAQRFPLELGHSNLSRYNPFNPAD